MNKNNQYRSLVTAIIVLLVISPMTILVVEAQEENSWTTLAPMTKARRGLGVATVNGKIYAMGGWDGSGIFEKTNEEYNLKTNTWTTKAPIPTPMGFFAITTYQDKIYCISNENGETQIYNPITDTWENRTSMPQPRSDIRANVIADKIYILGGNSETMNVYDPQTDSWSIKASLPLVPGRCSSVVFQSKIHVFSPPNLHHIYDPETNDWIEGERLIMGCYFPVSISTSGDYAPEKIYVFGAAYDLWTVSGPPITGQSYDPISNKWTEVYSIPDGHFDGGATVIDDRIYLVGGGGASLANHIISKDRTDVYTPFLYGSTPQLTITSPESKIYTQTTIPLEFLVTETTSWTGYSLDGQTNVTLIENTNLAELSEGNHTLEVFAIDMVGDETSSSVTFIIDTLPPNISILSPENKTYNDGNILLNVEVEEEISDMQYSLDGYENVTFTEEITLSDLKVGSHNITVYATDLAGHVGISEIIHFSIEPFPTTLAIGVVAVIVVVGLGIFLYFKKRRS